MSRKFSEDQKLNAIKLYQEGKSVVEASQLTGISSPYIKDLLSNEI